LTSAAPESRCRTAVFPRLPSTPSTQRSSATATASFVGATAAALVLPEPRGGALGLAEPTTSREGQRRVVPTRPRQGHAIPLGSDGQQAAREGGYRAKAE